MILAGLVLLAAPLADLRVGQEAGEARIEVVCGGPCTGRLEDGALLLRGVEATLDVPIPDGPLERVMLGPARGGARLTYAASVATDARLTPCGPMRVCLDLRFGVPDAAPSAPPDRGGGGLRAALAEASGDALAPPDCAAAARTLDADAWDLGAFRRVALCRAAAGRVTEAVGLLDRLLSHRDDPAAARARAVLTARLEGAQAPR